MKVTSYGKSYDVIAVRNHYQSNGTLAIRLVDMADGCPFANLTVNIPDSDVLANADEYAFVDTNNCPWAEDFIEKNKLGTPTGIYGQSGYCSYPLYHFT